MSMTKGGRGSWANADKADKGSRGGGVNISSIYLERTQNITKFTQIQTKNCYKIWLFQGGICKIRTKVEKEGKGLANC